MKILSKKWAGVGAVLAVLATGSVNAAGTLFVGSTNNSVNSVSVRDSETLESAGASLALSDALGGVVAGNNDDIYVTVGDTLSNFNLNNGLLNSVTAASGNEFTDVTVFASQVVVSVAGTDQGFSFRSLLTLEEILFVPTSFPVASINDGFGRLFITTGDTVTTFNVSGNEIASISADDPGELFVDAALEGTRLYVAVAGSINEVTARNPINLEEIDSFPVPFVIDSIAAGDDDDLFITSGNNIFHFTTDGEELGTIAGDATETFSDIAFLADPRPVAQGTVIAATTGVQQALTSRNAETLADAGSFPITVDADGIAVADNNEIFVASGDTLIALSETGAELNSVSEPGNNFADVALIGSDLYVATTGDGTSGVSIRSTATLAQTSFIATGFDPSAVAPGDEGEIYLTADNQVFRFSTTGGELASFASGDGRQYTDVALINNVVFATYNEGPASIENAISILDPETLVQIDVITTTIAATGITPGGANDYYISGENTIQRFELDEVIATFTTDPGTFFPDVAFSPVQANSVVIVSATLPSSRSVQVGTQATAFATVINTGPVTATGCRISPRTVVPADFSFQTTDPATNELVGTINTPVDIALDQFQTFIFSFTPTEAFPATDVELDFQCINAAAAPTTSGVNTLLLSGSVDEVGDVIALASTVSNNGIAEIPGNNGIGFFAVASVNVGIDADVNVQAILTDPQTNVDLTICQTDPDTGACINPTAPSADPVAVSIAAGDTPTFSVFAAATGAVPLDAANTRIQVQFTDQASGEIRGATSVAVTTE